MPESSQDEADALKVPVALGLFFTLAATLAWHPLPTGIWHDDGVYLLISKALASGEGLTYAGVVGSPPATKFPPLYPLVLVPFWLVGDDLAAGSGWVAGLNVLLMASAAAVFARFLIRHLDFAPASAAVVTLVAWCSPTIWQLTAIPLSEALFMFATCLALPASTRLFQGNARGWAWPFVLAFALAYLTRTAGIALGAAAVLGLVLRRDWPRALVLSALAAVVVLPWMVWSGHATSLIDPPFRDLLGSYGGWLIDQIGAAPGAYLDAVGTNLTQLAQGLGGAAVPVEGPLRLPLWVLLATTLAFGVGPAWKANPLLVGYPIGYLGILLVWPYRSGRLIAPVIPFLVLAAALGALRMRAWAKGVATRRTWLVAFGGAWAVVMGTSAWTLGSGRHLEPFQVRARTLARAVAVIEETATPSAVIGAPELWAAIHLHTGHSVAPSARFLPLAEDGLTGGGPEQQYEMWTRGGIDHLLVEHGGNVHGPALDRMDSTCGPGAVELLASFPGPGFFVRLAMDDVCLDALHETAAGGELSPTSDPREDRTPPDPRDTTQ